MNNFRKHRSTAFTMIFIIVFTILLDFYVTLSKFRDQESFSKTMLSRIETSNLQLNVFSQGIFAKHEKVLVASTNPTPRNKNLNSSIIFASSRNSNQIKVFLWKNKELNLPLGINLTPIIMSQNFWTLLMQVVISFLIYLSLMSVSMYQVFLNI
jgi:hypothetical protein